MSVGVGRLGNDVASADEALSRADASMYRSKARGGDSVDPEAADATEAS